MPVTDTPENIKKRGIKNPTTTTKNEKKILKNILPNFVESNQRKSKTVVAKITKKNEEEMQLWGKHTTITKLNGFFFDQKMKFKFFILLLRNEKKI